MSANKKVIVEGSGAPFMLCDQNFVAQGGEGAIYVVGTTAFKIYFDTKRMLPQGKMQELAQIQDPNVIRPLDRVLTATKHPCGYTMRFVTKTKPLCAIFPRAYRERTNLDHAQMGSLILSLRERVENTHKAGVLVVDLNEMNYLVDEKHTEVFAIDVDSYQTASYPATAIMPSVCDPLTATGGPIRFTEGSDWFSYACVSFQMFTGIHPYKGSHPSGMALTDRMKAGISVFDPAVALPRTVYPLSLIPDAFRDWYQAVFVRALRIPPPTSFAPTQAPVPVIGVVKMKNDKIVFTPVAPTREFDDVPETHRIVGDNIIESIRYGASQVDVVVANVLEHATRIHRGCAIANMLGETFLVNLSAERVAPMHRLYGIEAHKIVDARCVGRVCQLIVGKAGSYNRHVLVLNEYNGYKEVRVVYDITPADLNFVVLENGTVVQIDEEDCVEVWNIENPTKIRKIVDNNITNGDKLYAYRGKVGCKKDGKTYMIEMAKS